MSWNNFIRKNGLRRFDCEFAQTQNVIASLISVYIYTTFTEYRLQTNWHHVKEVAGVAPCCSTDGQKVRCKLVLIWIAQFNCETSYLILNK